MVVDTSIWLEILLSQPLSKSCLKEMEKKTLYIPSLCYYECFKKLRSKLPDHEAMEAISYLQKFESLDLTPEIGLLAADLSLEYKLAMADSFVLAHARSLRKTLLTLDNDFASIEGVKVLRA